MIPYLHDIKLNVSGQTINRIQDSLKNGSQLQNRT